MGELLVLFDGLPLAIAQAAAYIRTTHMDPAHYLALFQKGEENLEEFLSKSLPATIRNQENDVSRAVMTTWSLTVNRIQQDNPLSIQLLQLMSFLDPENIPSSLIQAALPDTENGYDRLVPLLNFALLTQLGSSDYRLHRLVGFWTRA
jgi:hypothetical protein